MAAVIPEFVNVTNQFFCSSEPIKYIIHDYGAIAI